MHPFPSVDTAAHRIVQGQAAVTADTDRDRAARVAARHLPWLCRLADADRDVCLDEVIDALLDGKDPTPVLHTWQSRALT
jgi:hypothetical protein